MSLVFAALAVLIATGAYLWVSFYEVPAGKFAIRNFFGMLYGTSKAGPALFWKGLVKPILLPVDFIELEFPSIEAYTAEGKSTTGKIIHQTNLELQDISVRFKLRDDLDYIALLMQNFGGSPMSEESLRANLQTILSELVSSTLIETVAEMDYVTVRTKRATLCEKVTEVVTSTLSMGAMGATPGECLVDAGSIKVVVGKVSLPEQLETAIRAAAVAEQNRAATVTDAEAAKAKKVLDGEAIAESLRLKADALGNDPVRMQALVYLEMAQGTNNTVVVNDNVLGAVGGAISGGGNTSQPKAPTPAARNSVSQVAHDNQVPQQLVRAFMAFENEGLDAEDLVAEVEQSSPGDAMVLRGMLMQHGLGALRGVAISKLLAALPREKLRTIGLMDAMVQKGQKK